MMVVMMKLSSPKPTKEWRQDLIGSNNFRLTVKRSNIEIDESREVQDTFRTLTVWRQISKQVLIRGNLPINSLNCGNYFGKTQHWLIQFEFQIVHSNYPPAVESSLVHFEMAWDRVCIQISFWHFLVAGGGGGGGGGQMVIGQVELAFWHFGPQLKLSKSSWPVQDCFAQIPKPNSLWFLEYSESRKHTQATLARHFSGHSCTAAWPPCGR